MALHKAQSQFARAQWKPLLLIPLWIIQVLLSTGMMGLFSWRLGNTLSHHEQKLDAGKTPAIEYAWEATNVGMSLVASICTLVEVGKYWTESLTPWTMLFSHIIKATCALAILALDIVVYITLSEEHYSLLGIGMDGLFIIVTSAMALYAVITHRRLSAYDDYSHPANVKGYGFNDYSQATRSSRLSMDKRGSLGSGRLSVGSINEPVHLEALSGPPTHYSHQRNTQFEEYLAQKTFSNGRLDEEGAIGSSPRSTGASPPSPPSPPGPAESPFLAGAVRSLQRGPTMRAASWASDHVLVSVPEEDSEMDARNTDGVSLLTPDGAERESIDGPRALQEADIPEPRWRRE